ncbi:BMP family lipoprotein [Natrialbaceae archaeon A-gly3]
MPQGSNDLGRSSERNGKRGTSRRAVLASGAVGGGMAIAGCLGAQDDAEDLDIAIISSNAGFDDRAFNDMALSGLEQAQEEYGFELNVIEETDIAAFGDVQAEAAEISDLVVLVGFQHTEPLETNAVEFPDTNWMLINDDVDEDNVAGYVWANHEMSYLAGVQAGTITNYDLEHEGNETEPEESQIGFVGGEEVPLIEAFEQAYVAGAEWANPDVEVTIGYAGSFGDPAAGEEVAESQYDDGADIVYHAAAATGPGIFDAAQAAERFAIGVDADQSVTLPEFSDVIIGSAVKFIDEGTYEAAEAVAEDNWEDVAGFNVLGLEEDAVDLVVGQEFEGELPEELEDNLEEARQDIIDGEIEVPCEHDGC